VGPLIELVIAILLPTAAGYVIIVAVRGIRRAREARFKPPPAEPLDRLAARLQRLRAELEQTESQAGVAAKSHRVRALRGAYLDLLCEACTRLEVAPPPGGDRAKLTEIYRVEAALRNHGLDVRPTAVP
jgi:broad specificity phosphatase PhoE